MNIKKIIKEEMDDFDWAKNINPLNVINNVFLNFSDGVNHDGWLLTIDGITVYGVRPRTKHPETGKRVTLKVVLGMDDSDLLNGKFTVWYEDNDGQWKEAKDNNGTHMVMSTNSVDYHIEGGKTLEEATKKVLSDFINLFYNNWFRLYEPLKDY